jgi:leucyl-tRNA synthetase
MEWLNEAQDEQYVFSKELLEKVVVTFSIMAPHLASELLETIWDKNLDNSTWPEFDQLLALPATITLSLQINGKTRGTLEVERSKGQSEIEGEAKQVLQKWLEGQQIQRIIFVPGRMVNFVIT